jgi:PKD repeat protein
LNNLAQTFTTNGNGSYTFTWTPSANAGNCSYSINWGNGNTGTGVVGNNSTFFQTQNFSNGTYTVTAVVTASAIPGCSVMVTQTISVSTVTCNLITNFTTSNGSNGLVNFNNTTSGTVAGTTYNWSFGDGGTSTALSPSHTYTANGAYVATLSANNNLSITCNGVMTKTIIVSNLCALNANFNSTYSNNGLVMFSNTTSGTIGATSYTWNFGDGGSSSAFSPNHTYANGTYTVKLTASTTTNAVCTSTYQSIINVTSNTCVANSNFSLVYSGTPKMWYAMPSNSLNISAVQWSWGDGSTTNTLFTSHTYSVAGMYSICLSVTLNCGQSSQSCATYSIYKGAGSADNEIYTINVIEEGTVGMKEISNNLNQNISFYPNPSSGKFVIELEKELKSETTVTISNLIGENVYTSILKNKSTQIDLNQVPTGIYLVKLQNTEGTSVSKIVIQK